MSKSPTLLPTRFTIIPEITLCRYDRPQCTRQFQRFPTCKPENQLRPIDQLTAAAPNRPKNTTTCWSSPCGPYLCAINLRYIIYDFLCDAMQCNHMWRIALINQIRIWQCNVSAMMDSILSNVSELTQKLRPPRINCVLKMWKKLDRTATPLSPSI
jgi:hypothetical protein